VMRIAMFALGLRSVEELKLTDKLIEQ
jgi:isopentenyl diphosphate isomerase/L-lactate dehydrogenase-like FMN-dependent dehydrogenase